MRVIQWKEWLSSKKSNSERKCPRQQRVTDGLTDQRDEGLQQRNSRVFV